MDAPRLAAASSSPAIGGEPPTTSGIVALLNLQAQIDGQETLARRGGLTVAGRVGLVELIALCGQILGRIADYERAEELAEQLVRETPAVWLAFLARARMRATFHRFPEGLADLATAERLGLDRAALDAERAAIFQAVGRYDEALATRRAAADRRASFETFGALAGLHAERGEITAAERLFDASRARYRGVSPFPLALLDFRRGRMWLEQCDLPRARAWFETASRRLPAFAPAQGHLAEVEAVQGEVEAAVARLRPLAGSSDDPEYAAQLARVLSEAGRDGEARSWRAQAAARYEELITRHPEAFADHAAEFWLTVGGDPSRALTLARRNLAVRGTPRAEALVARASLASSAAGLVGADL